MKKTHVLIGVISFILGLAAGIMFAIVKISKKFEYELETMFANHEHDDPDIEELYALDGFNGIEELEDSEEDGRL